MAKTCTTCKIEKDESEFSKVGGKLTYLRGNCKECRRKDTLFKANKRNKQCKQKLEGYGCCVCKITRAEVLEVHHLHSSYKRFGRSQSSFSNLQDVENGTAIVLCANDHSLFHGHFGGKNASFPPQTKESVINICLYERSLGGL